MERVSVTEAEARLGELVDKVSTEGLTIELVRNSQVIARISPAGRHLRVADLNSAFAGFPSLGDDAASFAKDVERIRLKFPRNQIHGPDHRHRCFHPLTTDASDFSRVPVLEVIEFDTR